MRRPDSWGEQFFQWIARHAGVAVIFFSLGAVFTALVAQSAAWAQFFGVLTALGTLAAAVAAFWSVAHTDRVQKHRDELEDAARMPYLQILLEDFRLFETPDQQPTYKFHFANMSQGSLLLRHVVTFDTQPHYLGSDRPDREGPLVLDVLNLIVAPDEIKDKIINTIELQKLGRTDLYFYFHHSVTGTLLYRLRLPVDIAVDHDDGRRYMRLSINEQEIEGPISQPFGEAEVIVPVPEVTWPES